MIVWATNKIMTNSPSKCAVIQLGARLHYMLPLALQEAGLLGRLYTDFCVLPHEQNLLDRFPVARLPKAAKRLLGRRIPAAIPSAKVRRCGLVTFRDHWIISRNTDKTKNVDFGYQERLGSHYLADQLNRHDFDGCDSLYVQSCNARNAITEAKRRGLPVIYESVGHPNDQFIDSEEYERFGLPPRYPKQMMMAVHDWFRRDLEMADIVLGASKYSVQGLLDFGVPQEKTRLLPYGLPSGFFEVEPHPEPGRILFVGSVGYRKGVPYLAEAARLLKGSHPEIEIRVAGSFDLDISKRPEFDGPTYLGQIPRSQVKEEFLKADLFVFPTVSDAFGIVLMEALQAGLPIIATPNCADALEDGYNGLRVPVRNGRALADGIVQIVKDRTLRDQMGRASLTLTSKFTPAAYSSALAAVFSALPRT